MTTSMSHDVIREVEEMLPRMRLVIDETRGNIMRHNSPLLLEARWELGRIIASEKQETGARIWDICTRLGMKLGAEYGRGFGADNLYAMMHFYNAYSDRASLSSKLSWSHYMQLSVLPEPVRRNYQTKLLNGFMSAAELRDTIKVEYHGIVPYTAEDDEAAIADLIRMGATPPTAPALPAARGELPPAGPMESNVLDWQPLPPYPIRQQTTHIAVAPKEAPSRQEAAREAKANHEQVLARRAVVANAVVDDLLGASEAGPSLALLKVAALLQLEGMRGTYKGALARAIDEATDVPALLKLMAGMARDAVKLDEERRNISVNPLVAAWVNARLRLDEHIEQALIEHGLVSRKRGAA